MKIEFNNMKKGIKSYKVFESDSKGKSEEEKKSNYQSLMEAKSEVEEALLPLKDSGFNVIAYVDNFEESDQEEFNCFVVEINKTKTEGTVDNLLGFNFADVMDDIWQAIGIPTDYDFQTYVMTILKDKLYFIWSPSEVTNLESVLEELGKIYGLTISFTRNGHFMDKIVKNIEEFSGNSHTLPGLDYKYEDNE